MMMIHNTMATVPKHVVPDISKEILYLTMSFDYTKRERAYKSEWPNRIWKHAAVAKFNPYC
jgi:hypothetical protein